MSSVTRAIHRSYKQSTQNLQELGKLLNQTGQASLLWHSLRFRGGSMWWVSDILYSQRIEVHAVLESRDFVYRSRYQAFQFGAKHLYPLAHWSICELSENRWRDKPNRVLLHVTSTASHKWEMHFKVGRFLRLLWHRQSEPLPLNDRQRQCASFSLLQLPEFSSLNSQYFKSKCWDSQEQVSSNYGQHQTSWAQYLGSQQ